jgi:dihydrofolate reductase
LNGRLNIIVTRQKDWTAEGVVVVHSLDDAFFVAKENDYKEIMIIGGGDIYAQSMKRANRIYLTRVHATLDGDAFFPAIDTTQWRRVFHDDHSIDEKHAYAYTFETWESNNKIT